MTNNLSKNDMTHLSECFDAYGLGESVSNGHISNRDYDSPELNEATMKVAEGLRVIERLYQYNLMK